MKRIDKLVYGEFVGPYLMSFFAAEFVLLMQFLWKQIDTILGKGISLFEILELLVFMAIRIIPMAIPISILISSVMVFGNMAEKFELSSFKSAGISLIRIMSPGIKIALVTAIFSIFCSNYLVPIANYEYQFRFERIKRTKPSLSIEEGVFNKEFKGFSIRVDKKHPNGKDVEDVLISNHTDPVKSTINVTKAKSGVMSTSANGDFFIMKLRDGVQYKENTNTNHKSAKKQKSIHGFSRTYFTEWNMIFDMRDFSLNADLYEMNKNKYDLLNTIQLLNGIDSLNEKIFHKRQSNHLMDEVGSNYKKPKNRSLNKTKKSDLFLQANIDSLVNDGLGFIRTFKPSVQNRIINSSKSRVSAFKDRSKSNVNSIKGLIREKSKYIYKLNEPYSWALICIIFLFIGAPLGSIIRKGGYGYPLIFAILFYMLFMIMVIAGQKLIRSSNIDPLLAAWLPCLVLLPVGLFLTIRAMNDSKSLNPFIR